MFAIFMIALAIGLLPAWIAHSKGHSFLAWWGFGALLWIVAMPCALMIRDERKDEADMRRLLELATMRKCPDCAELIQGQAKVCKHCGHRFAPVEAPAP